MKRKETSMAAIPRDTLEFERFIRDVVKEFENYQNVRISETAIKQIILPTGGGSLQRDNLEAQDYQVANAINGLLKVALEFRIRSATGRLGGINGASITNAMRNFNCDEHLWWC